MSIEAKYGSAGELQLSELVMPSLALDPNTVARPTISPAGGYVFSPTQVSMSCATAGAQIRYTLDGSDPTASSTLYSAAITVRNTTTVKARGYLDGKNPSSIATAQFLAPRTPENPTNTTAGLSYSYYEGTWTALPNFASLSAVKTGTVNNLDLSVRNRDDDFGIVYTGYIEVPQSGTYTFTTSSDDGSALYIGSTKVVDNDGTHATQAGSGSIGLLAGKHAIRVEFLEAAGEQVLSVSWQGPGVTTGQIPASALSNGGQATLIRRNQYSRSGLTFRIADNGLIIGGRGEANVSIVNANGQAVLARSCAGSERIALDGLAPGVYRAVVHGTDGSLSTIRWVSFGGMAPGRVR